MGDEFGASFCKTTYGYCNEVCKASPLQFYPVLTHSCIEKCIRERKLYIKKEWDAANRKIGTACSFLFEDLSIKYMAGAKIDFKPTIKCDESENTDT